jgi:signal transduction histidine kinase
MQAFAASPEESSLAEAVPRAAVTALSAAAAALRLRDEDGEGLPVTASVGMDGDPAYRDAEAALAARIDEGFRLLPGGGVEPAGSASVLPGGRPALAVPLECGGVLVGTLALFRVAGSADFGPGERRLLAALATQAAVAVVNARRLAVAERLAAELAAVQEIGQAIASRLELSAVLEAVVAGALGLMGSQHAQIILWDESGERLRFGAALGPESQRVRVQEFGLERGVIGWVARTRQPLLLNDYQRSPHALPEFPDVVATLTAPVLFGERLLGILHSHTTAPGRRFSRDDLRRLQLLATQAAIAIENARLFQEKERLAVEELLRLRKLAILSEIGRAMQGTMQLEALLRAILTGVTVGEGLGFNRAMLLLVDEARGVLEGRMGVGPDSGEEAGRVWPALGAPPRSLSALMGEQREREGGEDSAFNRFARSFRVPLLPEGGVLARTVLEGRAIRVSRAREDPRVDAGREGRLDVDEFVSVPLVAKGRVVGVVVADNKFNGKPISDEDLEFLTVFAGQAGLAVESAQVYTHLEEAHREIQRSHHQLLVRERLAALGEMAAHLVHEIRNPLVAIGGFARRLAHRLVGREPEGRYAELIAREVGRLEQILGDVREFSRESPLRLAATDLRDLVEECLVLVEERLGGQGVRLSLDLCEPLPPFLLDAVRVKQALLNLLANALEAMPEGGALTVRSETAAAGPSEEPWVALSVSDTGPGIPGELLGQIFDPFFTTKEAGTGLGLTVVRRIAREHGGRLEVESRQGEGATFRLWLPVRKEGA